MAFGSRSRRSGWVTGTGARMASALGWSTSSVRGRRSCWSAGRTAASAASTATLARPPRVAQCDGSARPGARGAPSRITVSHSLGDTWPGMSCGGFGRHVLDTQRRESCSRPRRPPRRRARSRWRVRPRSPATMAARRRRLQGDQRGPNPCCSGFSNRTQVPHHKIFSRRSLYGERPGQMALSGSRRAWDSNPRGRANALAVFKTAAIGH
jgi:hypothetical protein